MCTYLEDQSAENRAKYWRQFQVSHVKLGKATPDAVPAMDGGRWWSTGQGQVSGFDQIDWFQTRIGHREEDDDNYSFVCSHWEKEKNIATIVAAINKLSLRRGVLRQKLRWLRGLKANAKNWDK